MVIKMNERLRPARAILPGSILKEELEARGWTQQEFADIICKPVQAVNEIIVGKKSIIPETAILFSEALGTSAELWLNLESSYRLNIARKQGSNGNIARRAALYAIAPVKEMIKKGWISSKKSIDDLEAEIFQFFGINNIDEIGLVSARLRVSEAYTPEQVALNAWLRRAEILASRIQTSNYYPDKLLQTIDDIKKLSTVSNQIEEVKRHLANLGVRFVVVPHLCKTYVDGAAFWLDSNSPVVALSLRHNRIDNFWFTLMHEIAHILQHADGGSRSFIDENVQGTNIENACETEANMQAAEWLIPSATFSEFMSEYSLHPTSSMVLSFANEQGIHPSIVIGRMQHSTGCYSLMRRYLVKVCETSDIEHFNRAA